MHCCVFHCVHRKLSLNTCCGKESQACISAVPLWHNSLNRPLSSFYRKAFHCTGEITFPNHANKAGYLQGHRENWSESRAYRRCDSLLSLILALNKQIWDGDIHRGGFRSPVGAMVSQPRQELTDRGTSLRTHRWLQIILLHHLAVTLIIKSFWCASENHCFLESQIHQRHLIIFADPFLAPCSNNK